MDQIILVEDPDKLFQQSRRDFYARLLYGRTQQSNPATPMALRTGSSRWQWENFDPQFVAALPVLEAYSQRTPAPAGQPAWALSVRPNRVADTEQEEIVRRRNFGDAFRFIVYVKGLYNFYVATVEVPDLNDDPWLEWVHPGRNHAADLQGYRNYFFAPQPWQWSQLTHRAPDWYLQSGSYGEADTISREFQPEDWVLIERGVLPGGPFPSVRLELFQIEPTLGSITLIWSASANAAGYRLYTSGVPASGYMPASQQKLTLTGLVLGTSYTYAIVPVNGYGIDAGSLSNVIMYQHGISEIMSVYNLSSDDPGGDL